MPILNFRPAPTGRPRPPALGATPAANEPINRGLLSLGRSAVAAGREVDRRAEQEEREEEARQRRLDREAELLLESNRQNQKLAGRTFLREGVAVIVDSLVDRPPEDRPRTLEEMKVRFDLLKTEAGELGIDEENKGDILRIADALFVEPTAFIRKSITAKEVDQGKARTDGELRAILSNAADPNLSPDAMEAILLVGDAMIQEGFEVGWYGLQQAENTTLLFRQEHNRALAKSVINRRPLEAVAFFEDKDSVPFLPKPEKQDFLARAQREERRVQAAIAAAAERELRQQVKGINNRFQDQLRSMLINGPPGVPSLAGVSVDPEGPGGELRIDLEARAIDEMRDNPLYDADTVNRSEAQMGVSEEGFWVREQLRFANPAETQKLLADFAPASDALEFAYHATVHGQVMAFALEIEKARAKDPAGYAESLLVSEGSEATGSERVSLNLVRQDLIGIRPDLQRVVSESQAANIVGTYIDAKTGDDKAAILGGFLQEWGVHGQRGLRELLDRDTEALPPNARLMLHAGPFARRKMAEMEGLTLTELGKGLEGSQATDLVTDFDTRFGQEEGMIWGTSGFARTMPPGVVRQKIDFIDLGRRMTLFNAQNGEDDPVELAVQELFESQYEIAGTLRVPKGISMDAVQDHGVIFLESLEGIPLQSGDERADQFLDRLKDDGEWFINEDETGVVLYLDKEAVTYANGLRVGFLFPDAVAPEPIIRIPTEEEITGGISGEMEGVEPRSSGFGETVEPLFEGIIESMEAIIDKLMPDPGDIPN